MFDRTVHRPHKALPSDKIHGKNPRNLLVRVGDGLGLGLGLGSGIGLELGLGFKAKDISTILPKLGQVVNTAGCAYRQ